MLQNYGTVKYRKGHKKSTHKKINIFKKPKTMWLDTSARLLIIRGKINHM